MAELKVGEKAPDFTLPTGDGGELSLEKSKIRRSSSIFTPRTTPPVVPRKRALSEKISNP